MDFSSREISAEITVIELYTVIHYNGVMAGGRSRFDETGKKHLRKGVTLYKRGASPFWYARIWNNSERQYLVRSTKETSRLEAAEVAEEIYADLKVKGSLQGTPRNLTFIYFAEKLTHRQRRMVRNGERSATFAKDDEKLLFRNKDGVIDYFNRTDIRNIRTSDISEYLDVMDDNRDKPLSASVKNRHAVLIKKILRLAYDENVIPHIPPSPKITRKDNPRVTFTEGDYKKLLKGIKEAIKRGDKVKGRQITKEYYYFVLLLVHTYLRPTNTEAFAIKNKDIEVRKNREFLRIDVNGKTGNRIVDSTPMAVEFYENLMTENKGKNELHDYLFLPDVKNRGTAVRTSGDIFNHILKTSNLKSDKDGNPRTLYSLRHYGLQTRLRTSGGEINIYDLARNAGTSTDQLERFYLKYMERSDQQVRHLNRVASK